MVGARALVLDGEERASLAVVRSLTNAGYRVWVTARSAWAPAARSRRAEAVLLTRSALGEPLGFAREVSGVARRVGADIVFPLTDASLEAVLEHRALFDSPAVIPVAPLSVYRAASDKLVVNRIACGLGIGVEETEVVNALGDPAPGASSLYPGVVKPHRSVVGDVERHKTNVRLVANRAECGEALAALPPEAFPVLVQRRVRGPGEGFFTARWNGATLARFAHRRLREKPPSGGVSVFRESIALNPQLERACEGLLDQLGWDGVAMVELKRDLDNGGWRVMEINGRFWGSLQLAVDAGVDFPALLAAAALGAPASPPPIWREGVRLRWEWGDVDHLLLRLLRSNRRLRLPTDSPSRMGSVLAFLTHRLRHDRLEMFRASDPMPFVAETLQRLGVVG